MAIAQIDSSKTAESNNKIVQSPRKQFPKSYFTQSFATISRNPSENNSSRIFFARAMFSEWRVSPCNLTQVVQTATIWRTNGSTSGLLSRWLLLELQLQALPKQLTFLRTQTSGHEACGRPPFCAKLVLLAEALVASYFKWT